MLGGAVQPGGRLLDVGGGAGQLAVLLAEHLHAAVTVLDPTPEMLAHVPAHGQVTAVEGVAEKMPFEDSAFDAVVVSDAFHHFRDQRGAVREFNRVVRPEGAVLVLELDPSGIWMRALVVVEKLLGEPGAFFTPEQMCAFMAEHGISGHCDRRGGANYVFTGRVAKTRPAA